MTFRTMRKLSREGLRVIQKDTHLRVIREFDGQKGWRVIHRATREETLNKRFKALAAMPGVIPA